MDVLTMGAPIGGNAHGSSNARPGASGEPPPCGKRRRTYANAKNSAARARLGSRGGRTGARVLELSQLSG